jgi:hypothetical protein
MATKSTTTTKRKQTTFEKLSAVNVNKYVEKKNNLTYLSWAYAWAETKKHCPDARYEILDTEYDDAIGFMCHTQVTIEGETLSMWLPVMDSKNQAMKKQMYSYTTRYGEKQVAQATTTDINKTIMRCLTKNLAMFGLGIYIYAGEDMPMEDDKVVKTISSNDKPTLEVGDAKWDAMAKFCTENKALGYKKLCDKIGTKYTLSAGVKNEIKNLIK